MLANLKDVLIPALEGGYAVAAFNVFGFEDARAVVDAAEEAAAPVILAANPGIVDFMGLDLIAAMGRGLAETTSVPVCIHLDHARDLDTLFKAVDAGFTSVMYDGSQLPLSENVAETIRAVEYAHRSGVSVEAEIGSVPYFEGDEHVRDELTDPAQARRLAEETGVDALAVAVGNVQRLREKSAVIDFDRLAAIEEVVRIPLVIHGSSGIREADLVRLARTRVCKFNIGTALRAAFAAALRRELAADPRQIDRLTIMKGVMESLRKEAAAQIRLLRSPGS